jgi:hypothetical protein
MLLVTRTRRTQVLRDRNEGERRSPDVGELPTRVASKTGWGTRDFPTLPSEVGTRCMRYSVSGNVCPLIRL